MMTTPDLLSWLLQSTLGLGACWLLYHLALRREPTFQFNRGLLLLAPLLTAALPLLPLNWLFPVAPAGWVPAQLTAAWLPELQVSTAQAETTPTLPVLLLVYLLGAIVSLLWQAARLGQLWRQTRRLPRQPGPGYILRLTGGRLPVSSFGRHIFWDETLPLTATEAAQMLRHELVHVRQGHTADRLWLNLWQALLWFNPFVHLHARALALTHEYLADAAAHDAAPQAYSALLARQAVAGLGIRLPLAHTFSTSQTLTRIAMLHHPKPARRWKQWLLLPLFGLLLGAAACDKAEPQAPPPPPPAPAPAVPAPPPAPPAPPAEKVHSTADVLPEYSGGMSKLATDLGNLIKYPADAKAAGLEGKAFVEFVVGTDGRLRDIQLKQGVDAGAPDQAAAEAMNQAALQAVRQLPGRWKPGQKDGQPVVVSFVLPISFAL
ncbi:TonB family protein [Hymenobacter sp. B81]|uniref:TonB family protein n=1 Tax=Hymenobacter sp. B81 TaxID=3344878 RepID=UPI0037DBF526